MRHRQINGFTLLEIMLVVLIVGMLLTVAVLSLRNARQTQTLTAATQQLVNDLEGVRSNALQYSLNSSFTLTSPSNYTLSEGTSSTNRTLPTGVTVGFCQDDLCSTTRSTVTLSYLAPNGEVLNANFALKVQHRGLVRYIKVIGVTGKVVDSANL